MPLVKVVKNKTRCFRHDIKAQQGAGGTWILEKRIYTIFAVFNHMLKRYFKMQYSKQTDYV